MTLKITNVLPTKLALLFCVSYDFLKQIIYVNFPKILISTGRLEQPRIPVEWVGLNDKSGQCLEEMRKQIQMEINASNIYLAMAAHFSRDVVNRPGFAEHFFKSAREEREHGSKLIEYLSMRGQLTDSVTDLIQLIVST